MGSRGRLFYQQAGALQKQWHNSCSTPLTWQIGALESGYDIDEETIKQLMGDIANLWSDAVGKTIIAYSDSGEIDLNFIYSEEQKTTDNEQELSHKINKMKLRYYAMKLDYQELSKEYEEKLAAYNKTADSYAEVIDRYKQARERLSNRDVFSREENEELKNIKKKVDFLQSRKESEREALNAFIGQMQEESAVLNNYSDSVNKLIYHYKDQFSSIRTFHQAVYIRAGDEKKINVYQFEDIDRLRLVLAHEVGHALGLKHTGNPESIMYFEMDRQNALNLQLTEEDKQAIQARCAE